MISQANSRAVTFARLALARPALPLALCAALAFSAVSARAQDAGGTDASTSANASANASASGGVSSAVRDQAAGEILSDPSHGAGDAQNISRGAVTVRPGGELYASPNLRVAIVGATETGGDADMARRGMAAAYAAISVLPGYANIAPSEVAAAMRTTTAKRDAIRPPEYAVLNKKLKADRTLAITLRPSDATATSASYSATVDLIDASTGGLAGRGEATYTATEGVSDIATTPLRSNNTNTSTPASNLARDVTTRGEASIRERAVDGAVARAIFDLNRPVSVRGVVLNKMARSDTKGAPYFARISLGETTGVRVGTPIEYLSPQGETLGYGTIVDMAPGESLATVAPEAAYGNLYVNCEVRNLDNPPLARAGRPAFSNDEREWSRFERSFGLALAIAGAAYLITK